MKSFRDRGNTRSVTYPHFPHNYQHTVCTMVLTYTI
nr:MAG TPA: hypothetical protein [Caudoviricetes sp.]